MQEANKGNRQTIIFSIIVNTRKSLSVNKHNSKILTFFWELGKKVHISLNQRINTPVSHKCITICKKN